MRIRNLMSRTIPVAATSALTGRALSPDDSPFTAARRFFDEGVACLPVVDDGALVGVVTRRDLLRATSLDRMLRRRAA